MVTWEDVLGQYVGLVDKFFCSVCLNRIFRGSTGHWGQRIVLQKKPAPGMLIDEDTGHPITFTCEDCIGKQPQVVPQVHPNGELVNHINVSELADSDDDIEETRTYGDYDNRDQRKAMNEDTQRAFNQGYKNVELILKSLNEQTQGDIDGKEQEKEEQQEEITTD